MYDLHHGFLFFARNYKPKAGNRLTLKYIRVVIVYVGKQISRTDSVVTQY